ncbi:hypothetical protein Anas_04550 [Armadillidium nasatum]|uniref:Mic1 domain-containing protein n=1 Tax=Armadillidium nasatum TaxID=96803 RepID=A0A5N5SWR4_9CRUS|nr:hypothetical protein Anas_04550 [Armadillidium nasatum]
MIKHFAIYSNSNQLNNKKYYGEINFCGYTYITVLNNALYAKSIGQAESVSARKFLEVAMATDDPLIFFSTYKFFTQRNTALRGNSEFVKVKDKI